MEMPGFDAATYGDRFADVYDDWYGHRLDTDASVAQLATLAEAAAPDGEPARILELGVGTGRLAVPLADRGFDVTGVDASAAMLDALGAKPGGERVETILGDMAGPLVGGGRFDLIVVAWNTLFNLASEPAQRRCLDAVAGVLAGEDARFVVEAFVPDLARYATTDSLVEPHTVTADRVVLSAIRHEPESQELLGSHVELTEAAGVRLRPWHIRYLSPGQLDDLAADAGLTLVDRWAGWDTEPFDDESGAHVSVYRRTG